MPRMAKRVNWQFWRMLPVLAGLGLAVSCRDAAEKGRAGVLEAGYRFTIADFLQAASAGRAAVVNEFIAAGMQVDAIGPHGETALQTAAAAGQSHMVQVLLAAGANPNLADHQGVTPLIAAAAAGDTLSVNALTQACGELTHLDSKGRTALAAAAAAGQANAVALLAARSNEPLGGILQLASRAGHTGVIDSLLKSGRLDETSDIDWPSLLQAAAGGGHLPAVRLLNSRIPEGAANEDLRVSLANQARNSGHDEIADFLDAAAPLADLAAILPGIQPPLPDSIVSSLSSTALDPDPAEAAAPPENPPPASDTPVTLRPRSTPPARLAGSRFPTLACDVMADVPQFLTMVSWQRQAWPVILQDVSDGHGSAEIMLTEEPPRVITVRVGDEIPRTGCIIEKLRRRRIYTDAAESVLENVSELHFRRTATGETFKALAGVPVLSSDSSAMLHISGSEREWGGMPGDEFRLGSLLLRIHEIAAGAITLENRLSRGTISIALTPPP